MHPTGVAEHVVRLVLGLLGSLLTCAGTVVAESPDHTIESLEELQSLTDTNYQVIASLSVTGVVCAADAESRMLVMRDHSAAVLLEVPHLDPSIRSGDLLRLEATQIMLARNAAWICMGTAPVVEIDGLHPPRTRSGRVYLPAGWQPVRLEWFNGPARAELDVSYEGPGVSHQSIPDSALQYQSPSATGREEPKQGLQFASYAGSNWTVLPDFQTLSPVATGIVTNFDVGQRSPLEQVAMRFSGSLHIPHSGTYTFHLRSDDGARLFVGDPAPQCSIIRLEHVSSPIVPLSLGQALAGKTRPEWVSFTGKVTFASQRGKQIELEIVDRDQKVSVLMASPARLPATPLVNQQVRVTGICLWQPESRTPHVVVPGVNQLKITGRPSARSPAGPITTAAQVRGLQPNEARRPFAAVIRGTVTTANYWSCVVQDSTGPVFVRYEDGAWPQQPSVGESWEFEGITDPGEFSPIVIAANARCLGKHGLPEPIHPSWEQLLNGSMDVELVEIPGVVLDAAPNEMTLLTHGGRVRIVGHPDYPVPYATALTETNQTLQGGLVRVRGVFFAYRDPATQQLVPGQFLLGDGMISIEEPAPQDLFAMPARRVMDLLRFTTHANALTRFKISGQVLYARPREYFLLDGADGFRVKVSEPVSVAAGDLVEAVGFPQLAGPSPVLLEAVARKTGTAPLPTPRPLSVSELSNENNDASLVQVQARLLSDIARVGGRVLEVQAGPQRFVARLRTDREPAGRLRPGTELQLTGVYASNREDGPAGGLNGFELLLNKAADIVVLRPGPWWTKRHTVATFSILVAGLTMSLIWITLLRRTVAHRSALLEKEIHHREQTEQRRLLEQERSRVAHDLHDELGAGLAQISLIGSLAQRPTTQPERARRLLSQITDRSREMVAALDEIVWAINPKHDTATSVSGYLSDYAQELLRPTSVVCRLDVAANRPEQPMTSTHRHQLFLAFKEALTNVVKHAEATEVWIRIANSALELGVTVEDNGRGILPQAEDFKGNGIRSMRERLKNIGGRCEIKARPGGGTIVSFHLPSIC